VAAARVVFLFDASTPPALVRALREELGENAYHVTELLQPGAPDEEVLRYPGERGAPSAPTAASCAGRTSAP